MALAPTVRLALIREIYDLFFENVESFEEEDKIGPDLAYLLGAISKDTQCEWPSNRPLVKFLRAHCSSDHAVWPFIGQTAPECPHCHLSMDDPVEEE